MNTPDPMLPSLHPSEEIIISISRPPIRLGQFLKHTAIVQNGLEAKIKIQNGEVSVNGQLEVRRGRQLCHGDRVSMDNSLYVIDYLL
jgi:ribosome-associated protein